VILKAKLRCYQKLNYIFKNHFSEIVYFKIVFFVMANPSGNCKPKRTRRRGRE
jgi:hypothetical protein